MWPTSIAVWNCSSPPQCEAAVALDRHAHVGEPRLVVASGLDAAQMPAVRFAPATNCPSRSVSSATISPLKPTGPSEPGSAPNAARISSSVDGRTASPSAAISLNELEPVVAADEREHDGAVVGRHRHRLRGRREVDPEEARRAPRIVVIPGVSTSSGAASARRELGRARHRARDLEVGGEVAVLAA